MKNNKKALKATREANRSEVPVEKRTDLHHHLMTAEIVDQMQEATLLERQSSSLRKMVSRFGDAYFFHNDRGDFCLLTGFLK
jgi:hypothetical protein